LNYTRAGVFLPESPASGKGLRVAGWPASAVGSCAFVHSGQKSGCSRSVHWRLFAPANRTAGRSRSAGRQ